MLNYRPEIDGLRALAVTVVILFHAGLETFGGGFVGVDVFFVISGYLITSIVLSQLSSGTFSLANFYERRARRILPALFLVMFVCIPFAWFYMLPRDMKDFAESLGAVSLFLSNHLFLSETDYFETAAELKPLLHTWSLAVEEQYYFFFPLFMMLAWRHTRKQTVFLLAAISLTSFALAEWASHNKPSAAFFILPTRFWEIAFGGFLAFYFSKHPKKTTHKFVSETGGLIGLSLILYATFFYDKSVPFPGMYALVPVLGAILVILFANKDNITGKILSSKPFVGVGLISYSAYLWHQPLFAFARHIHLNEPHTIVFIGLSITSYILAFISWKWIESPFRNGKLIGQKHVLTFALIGSFFFISFGIAGSKNLIATRWSPSEESLSQFTWTQMRSICVDNGENQAGHIKFCRFGQNSVETPTFAIFGDSHSEGLNPVLDQIGKDLGISYVQNGHGGCLPLLGVDVVKGNSEKGVCESVAERQFNYVKQNRIKTVLLAASWTLYTQGTHDKETGSHFLASKETENIGRESSRQGFIQGVERTVSAYRSIGTQVIVVLQAPQQKVSPEKIYAKIFMSQDRNSERINEAIRKSSVLKADNEKLNEFNRSFFKTLESQGAITLFNPDPYFCDDEKCLMGTSSTSYYADYNHLNDVGVLKLKSGLEDLLRDMHNSH